MFLRLLIAYLFWAVLGTLGLHRFYLGRGGSGAMMLLLTLVGTGTLIWIAVSLGDLSAMSEGEFADRMQQSPWFLPTAALFAIVALWWLSDAILIAIMILSDAEKKADAAADESRFIATTANLDPSFQATRAAAGLEPSSDRRSGLPEGYVLPWRRENDGLKQRIYKPGEE